jgi:hypothetical protein
MIDADFAVPEEDELEEHKLEEVVSTAGRKVSKYKRASSDKHQMNGNGVIHGKAKDSKTDFEIPRKLLHSSIGTVLPLYLSCSDSQSLQVSSPSISTLQKQVLIPS